VGVLLDTSIPIKAQRLRMTVRSPIWSAKLLLEPQPLLSRNSWLGSIAEHQRRNKGVKISLPNFIRDVPIYPYLEITAQLAGRIGAEQAAIGLTIPPIDLMIDVTALSLGFSILTTNVRHFRMIPGLHVIPF